MWDGYKPDIIKAATREKQGKGISRKVCGKTKLPGNWQACLQAAVNKANYLNSCQSCSAAVQS